MKKLILFILLLLPIVGQAQILRELFINMPDSLCVLLTKNNRADFVDFLDSNMRAKVKNRFDKISEMKVLTRDYLFLETTPFSTLEIKLLPVNDSAKIICTIETYKGSAADSQISFYSTDWEALPMKDYLIEPDYKSFLFNNDSIEVEKRKMALAKTDMNLMKAELSSDTYTLSFVNTTLDYLDKESAEELSPFISSLPILYYWKEGRFIKSSN